MSAAMPLKQKTHFYDLPKEIRLQILGEANLTVSSGKFWWTKVFHVNFKNSQHYLQFTKDAACIDCTASTISWPLLCENHEDRYCDDCMILEKAWFCPNTYIANLMRKETWGETCHCTSCMLPNDRPCTCIKIPTGLFLTSHLLAAEAAEVLFGTNVFKLKCSISKQRKWLKSLNPSTLKLFRKLDLVISCHETCPDEWIDEDNDNAPKRLVRKWDELIDFITQNLDLPKLRLNIVFSTYGHYCTEDDMQRTIGFIQKPLGQLRDTRQFQMIVDRQYDWADQAEVEVEKAVKGKDYNLLLAGKIPNSLRQFDEDNKI